MSHRGLATWRLGAGTAGALLLALGLDSACRRSAADMSVGDAASGDASRRADSSAPHVDSRAPRADATDATYADAGRIDGGDGGGVSPLPPRSLRTDFGATCDGVTDDRDAFAAGIAAAAGNSFNLQIDATCRVYIHVGTDVTKPVFFEDGTTVQVLHGGTIIVDNVSIPTFNLVDTVGVTLIDWNVAYTGSMPPDNATWTSGSFNDTTLKTYLETNRNVSFPTTDAGTASATWASPTNTSAMFDIRGATSNVSVTGMTLTGGATGDKFIPMAFSMTAEAKRGETIYRNTPVNATAFAIPDSLTFSQITIDGSYFGWQGVATNSTFSHITSLHYGDIQNADGSYVGGCPGDGGGCTFAPPHLFYINEGSEPTLWPANNTITDVMDQGLRVGVARDPSSGNACSIKFGGVNSTINGYVSHRPDGLMDVLESTGNTIENVTATYDSTFCQDAYPIVRFPGEPYTNLTMRGMTLSDTAASTDHAIFPGDSHPGSVVNASVSDIGVTMNHWTSAPGAYVGSFSGTSSDTLVGYAVVNDLTAASAGQKDAVAFKLIAEPTTVAVGTSTNVTWSSTGATSCSAGGGWSGTKPTSGVEAVPLATAGTSSLTLTCTDGTDTGTATVLVTVTP